MSPSGATSAINLPPYAWLLTTSEPPSTRTSFAYAANGAPVRAESHAATSMPVTVQPNITTFGDFSLISASITLPYASGLKFDSAESSMWIVESDANTLDETPPPTTTATACPPKADANSLAFPTISNDTSENLPSMCSVITKTSLLMFISV